MLFGLGDLTHSSDSASLRSSRRRRVSTRMGFPHKLSQRKLLYGRPVTLFLIVLIAAATVPALASTRPVQADHAIVVSVQELASRAGAEIMQAGGNAVDAAVATGFALAVVYPLAGNLGGGGFMLIRMADGATHFIDYREKAPGAAT